MTNTPKEFDNCCYIMVKVVNLFKMFISENCTITKKIHFILLVITKVCLCA